MWALDNGTPFAVDRGFLRDRDGREIWSTVVKGTFDVRERGSLRLAEEQPPVARAAAWSGEPGKSSLLNDADFVLSKTGTDVILLGGYAYAPRGRLAPSIDVTLRVGNRAKTIRAHGIRAWMRGLRSSTVVPGPARVTERVRLSYEAAFGGADPDAPPGKPASCGRNPIGCGFSHRPTTLIDRAAPQMELVGQAPNAGPYDVEPVGFGAIAPSWTPRVQLAGTYDEAWKSSRAPLLPRDFDERFYRVAPPDQQQRGYLPAGEAIELVNLTPDGYLKLFLPDLSLGMRVIFTDGEERVKSVLHTVLVDPEARRVQLVWHASLLCHYREHKLTWAIVGWEGDRSCLSR